MAHETDPQRDEDLRALIQKVTISDAPEPFGAYVFAGNDPGAELGRNLEQEVFLEAFGNTQSQLKKEYGPYDSSSLFFCVVDHRRSMVAGMMRMILPAKDGPGLKSLSDLEPGWGKSTDDLFAEMGIDLDIKKTWDIATLAVARPYRSAASAGLVSLGIYQSFVQTALRVGTSSFVTILDHIAYRTLRIRVRVPFLALVEPRPYLGSNLSVPAYLHLSAWRERLRQVDSELLMVIFEGHGIEPALRPLDLEESAKQAKAMMSFGVAESIRDLGHSQLNQYLNSRIGVPNMAHRGNIYDDSLEIGAIWTGEEESNHSEVMKAVRNVIASRRLSKPAGSKAVIHLALEWGLGIILDFVAWTINNPILWGATWFVLVWIFAGNAGITHESVHGHLFRSKSANRVLGTLAMGMMFFSFATYRAYHWQHHARTGLEGDPEGSPLNLQSRLLYVAALTFGGLGVLLENLLYTVMTVVGLPPKWAKSTRHRNAIRLNAVITLMTIGLAVLLIETEPRAALELWLIPAGMAMFFVIPALLIPEHYGATGEGDILSRTRSVQSNPLLRWFFWNTNYHAAHHLAPSVPFSSIEEVEVVLEGAGLDQRWRLKSYSSFHLRNLIGRTYNRTKR